MRAPLLCLAALLTACSVEPGPEPEPEPAPRFLGADPSVPAAQDEARAGVVRDGPSGEAALFGGINAEGRAGDIKIYNDRVQFIVQRAERSHGIVDVGGGIIDADLVRAEGVLGRDTLEDTFSSFSLARLVEAESAEVLSDGSEGGAAVVRAIGRDVPWDYMQGLFELPEPNLPDLHLSIVTDYRLEPSRWSLQATSRLTNEGSEPVELGPRDGMFASGEDLQPWAPGRGLAGAAPNAHQPRDSPALRQAVEAVPAVRRIGQPDRGLHPGRRQLEGHGGGRRALGRHRDAVRQGRQLRREHPRVDRLHPRLGQVGGLGVHISAAPEKEEQTRQSRETTHGRTL